MDFGLPLPLELHVTSVPLDTSAVCLLEFRTKLYLVRWACTVLNNHGELELIAQLAHICPTKAQQWSQIVYLVLKDFNVLQSGKLSALMYLAMQVTIVLQELFLRSTYNARKEPTVQLE
jgi:hypothetical protein